MSEPAKQASICEREVVFYTVSELTKIAKVNKDTILNRIKDGTIAGVRLGTGWRIPSSQVEKLLGPARQYRARNGVYGGNPIFGYDRAGNSLIVNSSEQKIVGEMRAKWTHGVSCAKIALNLNTDNIKTKAGKEWTSSSVYCVVARSFDKSGIPESIISATSSHNQVANKAGMTLHNSYLSEIVNQTFEGRCIEVQEPATQDQFSAIMTEVSYCKQTMTELSDMNAAKDEALAEMTKEREAIREDCEIRLRAKDAAHAAEMKVEKEHFASLHRQWQNDSLDRETRDLGYMRRMVRKVNGLNGGAHEAN